MISWISIIPGVIACFPGEGEVLALAHLYRFIRDCRDAGPVLSKTPGT